MFPVFAAAFDEVCAVLDPLIGAGVRDVVWGADAAALDGTLFAQAGLFAVQVALCALLGSWGVRPDVVAGHSVGEIAAAQAAGVLSLGDACALVAARGQLMAALPPGGAMLAVAAPEEEVRALLSGDRAGIAAVNGPASVVVSGDADAVAGVAARAGGKTARLRVSHAFHSVLMEPMLAPFAAAAGRLQFSAPRVAMVSTVTGELADASVASAGYWAGQVRGTVRFADAVGCLERLGVTRLVEVGPDAVLTAMAADCLAGPAVLAPVMRRGQPEPAQALTAAAQVYADGGPVDWAAILTGRGGRRVDLPTYPFQRQRYWVNARPPAADVASAGLDPAQHPLLGAVVTLPGAGGTVLTGRLSTTTQPWPNSEATLVELAIHAGDQVGCGNIRDLEIQASLPRPEHGPRVLRITVGPQDESGTRPISVHSRGEDGGAPWTTHALGTLALGTIAAPPLAAQWPPPGAHEIEDAQHEGLRGAWRFGDDLYAEIALPDEVSADGFGVHPALLDGATYLCGIGAGEHMRPCQWAGVSLHAVGATAVRLRVAPAADGDRLALTVADTAGRPVLTAQSIRLRPADRSATGAHAGTLLKLAWVPVAATASPASGFVIIGDGPLDGAARYPDVAALTAAIDSGEPVPTLVLFFCPPRAGDLPSAARSALDSVLAVVQAWFADERFAAAELVVVTSSAAALSHAPVRGLVRSAQAENPGVLKLVDVDDTPESYRALPAALAAGEQEVTLRLGDVRVPRLTSAEPAAAAVGAAPSFAEGTVLITGATTGAGALLARHLAVQHGARRLLLTGDGEAPECEGAHVTVTACDVGDREALARLLADIPATHPLTAVFHTVAVPDNGLIGSLTAQRVAAVLRTEAYSAWHLHELTRNLRLSAFVLLSSSAGIVHGAGQASSAAASTFLDALAEYRRLSGLSALSLAFGPWEAAEDYDEPYGRRMSRMGMPALTAPEGLALVDEALVTSEPLLVPVRLDQVALRARAEDLPAVLRGLVRLPARRSAAAADAAHLKQRLAGMTVGERHRVLQELVRGHVGTVLGHASIDDVDPDRPFQELGFDSLAAIELRRRISTVAGLAIPATLVFDHPTSRAVAEYLADALEPDKTGPDLPVLTELDRLEAALSAISAEDGERAKITARLEALLRRWHDARSGSAWAAQELEYTSATDDELFEVLDSELSQ